MSEETKSQKQAESVEQTREKQGGLQVSKTRLLRMRSGLRAGEMSGGPGGGPGRHKGGGGGGNDQG
jgi:hypothetical protein